MIPVRYYAKAEAKRLLVVPLFMVAMLCATVAILSQSMIFFAPALLFVLWAWVQFARVYSALSLLILVILAEGFYRINTFGLGTRLVGDIALVLTVCTVLANFNRIWSRISQKQTGYMRVILLFWVAVGASIYFGSYIIFQQPLTYGLIPARKYLLFGVYFLLIGILFTRRDIFLFFKYLAWWGGVLALLTIIDAALGGGYIFSEYHQIGNERANATRLAVGTFNVCYSIIYCLVRLTQQKFITKHSLPYLFLLFLCLFDLFLVVMTRAAILGLACAVIALFIQNSKRFKVFSLVAIGVLIPATIFTYPYLEKSQKIRQLDELITSIEADTKRDKGNVAIRKQGASALLNIYWLRSPWVGVGTFSDNKFPDNPIARLSNTYGYNITDVNGLSTLIQFGLPGVGILFFVIIKTLKDTYKLGTSKIDENSFLGKVFFACFVYILFTPTLGNLLVERMLIYTGIILYSLDLLNGRLEKVR